MRYRVEYSVDGEIYTPVDNGKLFQGNVDYVADEQVKNYFDRVDARYVKIVVESFHGHLSVRLAAISQTLCGKHFCTRFSNFYKPARLLLSLNLSNLNAILPNLA